MPIDRGLESNQQVRTLFALGATGDLTDGDLLRRFVGQDGESAGLAFEILVARHGPMVLRVCRGVLRDPHDAQDAFQATFLVLVRKAGSIRDRDSLASWLHGVALRVASHSRADLARRRRHERENGERIGPPSADEGSDDLGPRLHEEVRLLPERYRAPVVLCYLEGQTCEDAARLLQWPVGTVKSRLSRARERLRRRLSRVGPAPAFAPEVPPGPRSIATLPTQLAQQTAKAAARFGARSSAPASASIAVGLAEGVLKAMTLAKLKLPAIALLAAASCLGVASALTPASPPAQAPAKDQNRPAAVAPAVKAPEPDPMTLVAPRDLTVRAGNGTALVYALDEKGKRIIDPAARDPGRPARRPGEQGPWIEAELDLRWVAIVGVLDRRPDYRRIDVERQTRRPDGGWSDWGPLDLNRIYQILDNLPEVDRERIPEGVRPGSLVDPLPFLKKGTWSGVDPEILLKLPATGSTSPARTETGPVPKGETRKPAPPVLMVRSLDFTVEAGMIYRYRARAVVKNPARVIGGNFEDFFGAWSEPTSEVQAP